MSTQAPTRAVNNLVISYDSEIGRAIYEEISEEIYSVFDIGVGRDRKLYATSRFARDNILFDVTKYEDTKWPAIKFDRVFYCLAADPGSSAEQIFNVNVLKAFEFLRYALNTLFTPRVQLFVLTSQFGSIGEVNNAQVPYYRMSKAALNMGLAILQKQFPDARINAVHPGLVDTKMTQGIQYTHEKISTKQCADNLLRLAALEKPFGFYDAVTLRRINW